MEYYTVIKTDKTDEYLLTWRNVHDKSLIDKEDCREACIV